MVYAYNHLDIIDGIAFLRIRGKIPEYAATYYRFFSEYGITIMAWYSSIPVKEGSTEPYDTRSLSDNWASLVEWLREELREKHRLKAYGVDHLPPEIIKELDRCKVDKNTMFRKVTDTLGPFEVA